MADDLIPRVGLTFRHRSWRGEDGEPLLCRITSLSRGLIYYRPVAGGAPMYCEFDEFGRYASPES